MRHISCHYELGLKKSSTEEKCYEHEHISIISTEIICKIKKFRQLWQSIIRDGQSPQFS